MTEEKILNLLNSYKEGKTIEYKTKDGNWCKETNLEGIIYDLGRNVIMRVKPDDSINIDEVKLDKLAEETFSGFIGDSDTIPVDVAKMMAGFNIGFKKADDIFVEFLSGLKCANVWEGTEWKYQRLWREAKKAMEE